MSEFSELIKEALDERESRIHTAILARVERVNSESADVKPIQGEFPLLKNLPIIKHRYEYTVDGTDYEVEGPIYESGDIVLVIFLEKSRDGKGKRMHSLEDGIIAGLMP